jgi:hypothetical protein
MKRAIGLPAWGLSLLRDCPLHQDVTVVGGHCSFTPSGSARGRMENQYECRAGTRTRQCAFQAWLAPAIGLLN